MYQHSYFYCSAALSGENTSYLSSFSTLPQKHFMQIKWYCLVFSENRTPLVPKHSCPLLLLKLVWSFKIFHEFHVLKISNVVVYLFFYFIKM